MGKEFALRVALRHFLAEALKCHDEARAWCYVVNYDADDENSLCSYLGIAKGDWEDIMVHCGLALRPKSKHSAMWLNTTYGRGSYDWVTFIINHGIESYFYDNFKVNEKYGKSLYWIGLGRPEDADYVPNPGAQIKSTSKGPPRLMGASSRTLRCLCCVLRIMAAI